MRATLIKIEWSNSLSQYHSFWNIEFNSENSLKIGPETAELFIIFQKIMGGMRPGGAAKESHNSYFDRLHLTIFISMRLLYIDLYILTRRGLCNKHTPNPSPLSSPPVGSKCS